MGRRDARRMAAAAAASLLFAVGCEGLAFNLAQSYPTAGLCATPIYIEPCVVEKSTPGVLRRLMRRGKNDADWAAEVAVARSYDGRDWEGVHPAPARMTCVAGQTGCAFDYDPNLYRYRVAETAVTPPVGHGVKYATAKLLAQATFGTRGADVDAFDAAGGEDPAAAGAWFDAQVTAAPFTAREYLRRRQNPRAGEMLGAVYEPCEVGARWHRHVFTNQELNKALTVTANGAGFTLAIDGEVVSEIDAWEGGAGTYYLCTVGKTPEELGNAVQYAAAADCAVKTTVANPAVAFAAPPAGADVFTAAAAAISLAPLQGVDISGVAITQTVDAGACPARTAGRAFYFLYDADAGIYYRYDRRIKMFENTFAAPSGTGGAAVMPGAANKCTAAPATWLNRETCVRGGSTCAAMACGSRGEVANDPNLGHMYITRPPTSQKSVYDLMDELDFGFQIHNGKQLPFHNIALWGAAQLRFRIAWALYQLIPISEDIGDTSETEAWNTYFDVFAGNAFGNYRDVLKEVAFHNFMGKYLSYKDNAAYAESGALPDQNFAREIMQLFSIGLYELRIDGTPVLVNGAPVQTYDTKDINTFARAWTGFRERGNRANVEAVSGIAHADPMYLDPEYRDALPKADLRGGYIGDHYPLCRDLPQQHFLHPGARYSYQGTASAESAWDAHSIPQYAPPASSGLYQALCGAAGGGACTFPAFVTLGAPLACEGGDAVCAGVEDLTTVKIVEGATTAYYTYERPRCVKLAIFAGKELAFRPHQNQPLTRQCADPREAIASTACCAAGGAIQTFADPAGRCFIVGEKMRHATAAARCAALGFELCPVGVQNGKAIAAGESCAEFMNVWLESNCSVKIQVHEDGAVNLVAPGIDTADARLRLNTLNVFYPQWQDGFPTAAGLGAAACVAEAATLLCDVELSSAPLFTGLPSAEAAAAALRVGAYDPTLQPDRYQCHNGAAACPAADPVVAYVVTAQGGWTEDTVIGIRQPAYLGGRYRYYRNGEETVRVAGGAQFAFRNAPVFMPLSGEVPPASSATLRALGKRAARDAAHHETDAVLDHLFYHPNTAPHMAHLLIQKFVTSNPSPRYVEAAATAFTTGDYGGRGSGKYGCMKAMMAAILLDPEARSTTLDADPSHGMLREPFLKLTHTLRALDVERRRGQELAMYDLVGKMGQDLYRAPSVFGFYLPQYQPNGPVSRAGLVSPEAQLLITPRIFGLLNGLKSALDHGLSGCDQGFGMNGCNSVAEATFAYDPTAGTTEAPTRESMGAMVDQLDLRLTGGRLSAVSKEVVLDMLNYDPNVNNAAARAENNYKTARALMILTPEFHATNFRLPLGDTRVIPAPPAGTMADYKAVIAVFLEGGADSLNFVVPKGSCAGELSYAQYVEKRGNAALAENRFSTITPEAGHAQPCTDFYLNNDLANVRDMFNAGDGAIFGNIGNLVRPMTKDEPDLRPPFLFAHNMQQRHAQSMHAQHADAKGILGRMAEGFAGRTGVYSMGKYFKTAEADTIEATILDRRFGTSRLKASSVNQQWSDAVTALMSEKSGSVFADTYQAVLQRSIGVTDELKAQLDALGPGATSWGNSPAELSLKVVSQIIRLRAARQVDRDVFTFALSSYDTHGAHEEPHTAQLDAALNSLKEEMVAEGQWANVVAVAISDFGRTIQSNGQGTDHAWGGNYFAVGGSIKDKVMLGAYAPSLGAGHDLAWGNGVLIPSWGYEVMWGPVVDWFGIAPEHWYTVLPNLPNFPDICAKDLFDTANPSAPCVMPEVVATPEPPTPTPVTPPPLGAFTDVCPWTGVPTDGSGVAAAAYAFGRVGDVMAVQFQMTLAAGTWGALGLRDQGAVGGMLNLDVVASDASGAAVQDYEPTAGTYAPIPTHTATALASADANGTHTVVTFYRVLDNAVDYSVPYDGRAVNVALASGAGTIQAWAQHTDRSEGAVTFTPCHAWEVYYGMATPHPPTPEPPRPTATSTTSTTATAASVSPATSAAATSAAATSALATSASASATSASPTNALATSASASATSASPTDMPSATDTSSTSTDTAASTDTSSGTASLNVTDDGVLGAGGGEGEEASSGGWLWWVVAAVGALALGGGAVAYYVVGRRSVFTSQSLTDGEAQDTLMETGLGDVELLTTSPPPAPASPLGSILPPALPTESLAISPAKLAASTASITPLGPETSPSPPAPRGTVGITRSSGLLARPSDPLAAAADPPSGHFVL